MAIAKRKKRFFDVKISIIQKTTQLQAYEQKELGNRFIKYDLTRYLKGKASILTIKTKFEEDKIKTIPYEFRLLPIFTRRMVRRGTSYVEDSFKTKTKDGEVAIKPLIVTRRKVSRAVRKDIRNKAKEELIKWANKNTNEKLFSDLLKNKIQKELALKLKKIYPLSSCEIRVLKAENEKEVRRE